MFSQRKKILVVCSRNKQRSLTAEFIYKGNPLVEVRSAGTSPNAKHQVSSNDIAWADVIICMEQKHKQHLHRLFEQQSLPQIVVADIPDEYSFMDPELCNLLRIEVGEFL